MQSVVRGQDHSVFHLENAIGQPLGLPAAVSDMQHGDGMLLLDALYFLFYF